LHFGAVGFTLSLTLLACPVFSADWIERLDVETDPAGGVRGTARITYPVKLEVIQAILTDFARWPELFETPMRVESLIVERGVATVDVRIDHSLLPGERRLVSETRVVPGGGIVTDLKSGDFTRYHREWRLTPISDGQQTSADFELVVEIKSILPDWLVALSMRRELEAHFKAVKEKALAKAKGK
jgi:ribosome-associated toxin RatA of RatAB toxin-antitoxin module